MDQIDWQKRIFKTSIELDITLRCNLVCINCDRAIRHAPENADMTIEQIKKFIQETKELDYKWEKLKLIGGEPTLHPQLDEIIKLIKEFHKENPQCEVQLWTNGYGEKVKKILEKLPKWIIIINSRKEDNRSAFVPFNLAPIDDEKFKDCAFELGCPLLKNCGFSLNKYGYYSCAAGSTVDRVFGLKKGIGSLKEFLANESWQSQLKEYCKYCGHFKHPYNRKWTRKEKISKSWEEAYKKYKIDH